MKSSFPYGTYKDGVATYLDTAKNANYQSHLRMNSVYECNEGIYVLPLSDPDATSVVFMRLHNKVGTRSVVGSVVKAGTPPVIPAPMDAYVSGDVILSHTISISKPVADSATGGLVWEIGFKYDYGQADVRDENYHFETGLSSIGESYLFGSTGQNANRGGGGGAGTTVPGMAASGFNGVYPPALYGAEGTGSSGATATDNFVPIVDFSQADYSYMCPIFSNQFFVQQLIM